MNQTKLLVCASIFALALTSLPHSALAISANSLIKGSTPAVYFYAAGQRYAFPNETVFKSWYPNFSGVTRIADRDLENIPYVGEVTIQPGSKLVKNINENKVYAVSRYGVLHWIQTEQLAAYYAGQDWKKQVVDLTDTAFKEYVVGYALDKPGLYLALDEMSATLTPADNLRPLNFVPAPKPTQDYPVQSALGELSLSTHYSEVIEGQTVKLTAELKGNGLGVKQITIGAVDVTTPLAVCRATEKCTYSFEAPQPPFARTFYATAEDISGRSFKTQDNPVITVMTQSADIQLNASPLQTVTGQRVSVSSQYNSNLDITAHRLMAIVPGAENPISWLDCDTSKYCAGSIPLYRDTKFFAVIDREDALLISKPLLVTAQGGTIPKPVIKLVRQIGTAVEVQIIAPKGEGIGPTFLIEGQDPTVPALAMCEDTCTLTLQLEKSTELMGVAYIGGELEKSEVLKVSPYQE
ncbi:MAG: hypothetical protein WC641_07830 [Patescibacteria group bacterium]